MESWGLSVALTLTSTPLKISRSFTRSSVYYFCFLAGYVTKNCMLYDKLHHSRGKSRTPKKMHSSVPRVAGSERKTSCCLCWFCDGYRLDIYRSDFYRVQIPIGTFTDWDIYRLEGKMKNGTITDCSYQSMPFAVRHLPTDTFTDCCKVANLGHLPTGTFTDWDIYRLGQWLVFLDILPLFQ